MLEIAEQVVAGEWVAFPGGEVEGQRPKALCALCREALSRGSRPAGHRPLCFQCYRVGLDRQRSLQAAGQLDTATPERFQHLLPFEPVNRARLERLKAEHAEARLTMQTGIAAYANKRRHAQIAARHALQRLAEGLKARALAPGQGRREMASAVHAAELQLPESWLAFVVSR